MIHVALRSSSALRTVSLLLLLAALGCDESASGNEDTTDPITERDAGNEAVPDAGGELDAGELPGEHEAGDPPPDAGQPPDAGEVPDASEDTDAGSSPDAGGGDDAGAEDAGLDPVDVCSTTVAAANNGFVELCALDQPVRHVRIEGLLAPQVHASTQIVFGFASTPPSNNPTIGEGQLQALFYGGGFPAPGPMVVRKFGAHQSTWTDGADFMHMASTACFDVHDGTDERPPYFVLWIDGQAGADCEDPGTLTLESAFAKELAGPAGTVDKEAPVFVRQAALEDAIVTVSSHAVLDPAQIEASL
jgi:hypothetical protein